MLRPRASAKEMLPLLAAVLVLYWRPALGQGVFFQRDIFLYWIPRIDWAVRSLAAGRLPQWEASLGFGLPFLADPNLQPFYPFTWLNLIFQPSTVFSLLVVGHTVLGAIGAYHLLRRRLRSREAAWVGSINFVAAGALVSSANLWHHYSSAMYMPWVADAFLRVRRGRGGSFRLAVCVALQALAGSADVVLMTAFGLLFLLPLKPRRLTRLVPRLGAAAALCCALAAAQWLPTAMGATSTVRAALQPHERLYWSVPPVALMDFVLPLSGVAHARDDQPEALEHRFRLITSMYLGVSTVPLLIRGARRWPRGLVLLMVSLALALGRHGPLVWVSDLPIVSMFRFPSKILWLFSLAWAALTAVGMAVLAHRPARFRKVAAMSGALLLCLAAVVALTRSTATNDDASWPAAWRIAPWAPAALGLGLIASSLGRGAALATALVVTVDLVAAGQRVNAYSDGEMFRMRPSVVDVLKQLDAYRIFVLPTSRREARSWRAPAHWSDEEAYFFGQGQMLVPPQGVRWGLKGSFDGDFAGLAPRDYTLFSETVTGSKAVDPKWLRLGGVTHVLRFAGADDPGMEVAARVQTFHEHDLLVLRVPDPQPRAYLASRIRIVDSTEEAIRSMIAPDFDPAGEIFRVKGPRRSGASTASGSAQLRIEEQIDGKTTIRVALDAPRTLVVLDALSAGWSARVDGRPAVMHPANLVFQSVDLEPGDHLVELEYQTPGLVPGLSLSLIAWLGVALRSGVRRNRQSPGAVEAP